MSLPAARDGTVVEPGTGATAELFIRVDKAAGTTITPDLAARSGNGRLLRGLVKGRPMLWFSNHAAPAVGHTLRWPGLLPSLPAFIEDLVSQRPKAVSK